MAGLRVRSLADREAIPRISCDGATRTATSTASQIWEDRKKRVLNPRTGIYERVQVEQYFRRRSTRKRSALRVRAGVFGDSRKVDVSITGVSGSP